MPVCTRGQKTREGAASAVRHRHDHRHRGQTSETQELFDADKRPGEKCGLGVSLDRSDRSIVNELRHWRISLGTSARFRKRGRLPCARLGREAATVGESGRARSGSRSNQDRVAGSDLAHPTTTPWRWNRARVSVRNCVCGPPWRKPERARRDPRQVQQRTRGRANLARGVRAECI